MSTNHSEKFLKFPVLLAEQALVPFADAFRSPVFVGFRVVSPGRPPSSAFRKKYEDGKVGWNLLSQQQWRLAAVRVRKHTTSLEESLERR